MLAPGPFAHVAGQSSRRALTEAPFMPGRAAVSCDSSCAVARVMTAPGTAGRTGR